MMLKPILLILIIILFSVISSDAGTIRIIYTANINGSLENCGCGTDPLGGIGRIKTFIDTYRKAHRDALLIDGGDFFNSYPFPELNQAMLQAMHLCAYDLVLPGDQAFIEGEEFYKSFETAMAGKILISNQASAAENYKSFRFGTFGLLITAILSPSAFEFIDKPEWINLLKSPAGSPTGQKDILRVIVFHGSRAEAEKFASGQTKVDLILMAHDQEKGLWKFNGVLLVGNGKDSEYVSVIEARYDAGWKIDVQQVSMSDAYPEPLEILDIIRAFKIETEGN
jgi:2',3'-cyclic-nucleotide 2'-phosphodiesterase (5'-nucleotidase family)